MVRITFAAALVLSMAGLVAAQDAETPACGQTCIVNMIQTPNLGCEAGAMDCLCPQEDFFNGIADCAKDTCDDGVIIVEEAAAAASNSAVAMCASATVSAAVSSTEVSPSSTTDSSSTTERPSAEQSPQSTETESTASKTSADADPTGDADDADDEDDEKSEGKGKKDDDDKEDEPKSAALSIGARAGIGAAAGVVGVSILSLLVFFIMRRRRAARPAANFPRYTISGPMPGGGRDYGNGSGPAPAKRGMASLDFSARRYEDMLPRVQPTSNI